MAQNSTSTSANQLAIPGFSRLWHSKGVFSEHYIRTRLQKSTLWPKENEIQLLYDYCAALWHKKHAALTKSNEAVTRQELIDPMLQKLGFSFLPNISLPVSKGGEEPDYILFASEEAKDSILGKNRNEQYSAAITLLEAKKFDHPLDAVSTTEIPGRFPHRQLRDYLQEATDTYGRPYFNWAVLTNGSYWRLYCRNAHPASYFEVDFRTAISSFDNFMLFVALFRPIAFIQYQTDRCPLDDLRAEALDFQTNLEDDLRRRIYSILVILANGFYSYSDNNIQESDMSRLYDNCLIFLYRLLFVLYAEGRGLLPARIHGVGSNRNYREKFSLQRLIPRLKNTLEFTSNEFTDLYEGLIKLFHLINGNNPRQNKACSVPLYNGRLFDPIKYSDLEVWRVGSKTLAEVLRGLMLSCLPVSTEGQRSLEFGDTIDYADLEVRQLGSIYEGLLEMHLHINESGFIELIGDKAARKATGTYYTPDYVVRYIVENTLTPLINEINESEYVKRAIDKEKKDNSFADALLDLNILDPAIGSGHFLVRATEFLADCILNHPTTAIQIKTVPEGVSQEEREIAYWRRRVVESCVYGVDLNPLAVELAKLSLWLTCISTDKPLNFLDHHLRIGDSLFVTPINDMNVLPSTKRKAQRTITFGPNLAEKVCEAINTLRKIESTESSDLETIKNKESEWNRKVRSQLRPYTIIGNLWLSTFFGHKINQSDYDHILQKLVTSKRVPNHQEILNDSKVTKYEEALESANRARCFHWELEFPEVFFNESGFMEEGLGFDAVIGNPPWGADISSESYVDTNYERTRKARDTAAYFLELASKLSKKTYGMIVKNSIVFVDNWHCVRGLVLDDGITHVLNPGIAFADANIESVAVIINKSTKKKRYALDICLPLRTPLHFKDVVKAGDCSTDVARKIQALIAMPLNGVEQKLLMKMSEMDVSLGDVTNKVCRGMDIGAIDKPGIRYVRQGPQTRRYFVAYYKNIAQTNAKNSRVKEILQRKLFGKPLRGTRLAFCYDPYGQIMTGSNYVNIFFNEEHDRQDFLHFMLGLLNSKVISFYVAAGIYSKNTETARHLDSPYVSRIPLPTKEISEKSGCSKAYKKAIDLVKEILGFDAQFTKHTERTKQSSLLSRVVDIEHEIDKQMYYLYGLTSEEIKAVESFHGRM